MYLKGIVLTKQKAIKYCTDSTCVELVPICCLFIHQECSENTTKWYHLSAGEHVCSSCYNHLYSFFSYEIENSEITSWKQKWLAQSQETPTIYDFISSTLLSNWYSCIECGKWRQISRDQNLTRSEINKFSCKMILQHSRNPCLVPEDQRIEFIRNHPASFFESIKYPVYLGTSPYLNVYDEYSLDTVGISPIAERVNFDLGDPCKDFMTVFNPFSKETNTQTAAGAADPTCMDKWEYEFFPTFSSGNLRSVFLGLRNLMLLLWSANPKRTVNVNLVAKCVSLRGLARVALLINSVPDLIKIYSGFGYVNFGFPDAPVNIFEENMKKDVIVVGAGLSGLSAARHLSLLGANVTVLEATDPLVSNGKRISLKMKAFECFNEVFGVINNPFSVLAHQCNIETREISTDLSIFDEKGSIIPDDIDQFYQNLVYNFVAYLMGDASVITRNHSNRFEGCSLADLYRIYRRERISPELASSSSSRIAEGVENIYLSEIEYRVCGGASLDAVPHSIEMPPMGRGTFNFNYKQFSGGTFESAAASGWGGALSRLFENVDVRYDSRVEQISRLGGEDGGKYLLQTARGNQFSADKVLFAVPPWSFAGVRSEPDWLGNRSILAEGGAPLGSAFIIVRMAYDRENLFWRSRIPASSCERAFAIVPVSAEQRGFCHVFKETSAVDGATVLQTKIFGLAARACAKLSDEDIVNRALDKLACLSGSGTHEGGPPRPVWHEIIRNENAFLACTDIGIKYNQLSVSNEYQNDIFVTNKVEILAEPISLSNSFCVGMEAASSVLKNVL